MHLRRLRHPPPDRLGVGLATIAICAAWLTTVQAQPSADLLLRGGLVYDGTGRPAARSDVAVTGDRITFVGNADAAGITATRVLDVDGLMVTPGFIDMHSDAVLTEDYGRDAVPFLTQGITTVAIGVDGGGTPDVGARLRSLEGRIGANAFTYVGHGAVRGRVLGQDDRAPSADELEQMRALVRRGMA